MSIIDHIVRFAGMSWAEQGDSNYYTLHVWAKAWGKTVVEETYHDLTWGELQDVVEVSMAVRRPGWSISDSWTQPPLPFDA
jgi:hypothetical protein